MASAPVARTQHRIRAANVVREDAQTMAEYAVVLAVITPLLLAALSLLGTNVAAEIEKVASYLKF